MNDADGDGIWQITLTQEISDFVELNLLIPLVNQTSIWNRRNRDFGVSRLILQLLNSTTSRLSCVVFPMALADLFEAISVQEMLRC